MEKISVLLPSRKRFEILIESIESLLKNCHNINNVEILIGLDDDDIDSIDKVNNYNEYKSIIKTFIFDRKTYRNLHHYYNELSKMSLGTSLFLWNDDAIMKSKDWDLEIIKNHKDFCVINPKTTYLLEKWKDIVLFPIIPKKWIDLTDIWSPYRGCDSWIDFLGKKLNIIKNVESIIIEHDRFDITGNNNDTTYHEGRIGGEEITIHSELLNKHYNILHKYLNDNNKFNR